MTGAGGIGTTSTSKLTRLLQEKAEAIRKRRKAAEDVLATLEERVRLLGEIDVQLPDTTSRLEPVLEARKRSDWEAVETGAKAVLEELDRDVPPAIERKRTDLLNRLANLRRAGAPLPPTADALAQEIQNPPDPSDLSAQIRRLAQFTGALRGALSDYATSLRDQGLALAKWAGLPDDRLGALDPLFNDALSSVATGEVTSALDRYRQVLLEGVPEAASRRDLARASAQSMVALGGEVGLSLPPLKEALTDDDGSFPTVWKETVPQIEERSRASYNELREKVVTAVDSLLSTVEALREFGADPTAPAADLRELLSGLRQTESTDLAKSLSDARQIAQEPVVEVVAGLLDEVRPKLVELKQLERDPSEVLAAMNRAREALRLRIYGEALAAAQEAMERSDRLTADLDALRDEVDGIRAMIDRLGRLKVPVEPFKHGIGTAETELSKYRLDPARAALRETVRGLGRDALKHFGIQLKQLETVAAETRERGVFPAGADEEFALARRDLEKGALVETGERLAQLDVRLREAVAPYVARRLEEMETAFKDLSDPELATSTRRHLADAEVSLRVREDANQSLDSLRKAEHEFSLTFATEASERLARLEEHQKLLTEMGGPLAEFDRQLVEIRQIFDMGDFVRASQSAGQLAQLAVERETARAEKSITESRLALVELDGLDLPAPALRSKGEAARAALSERRPSEAHRLAQEVAEQAHAARASAEEVGQRLAALDQRVEGLTGRALDLSEVAKLRGQAAESRRAMEFARATDRLAEAERLIDRLVEEAEIERATTTSGGLIEEARHLGLPVEAEAETLSEGHAAIGSGRTAEGLQALDHLSEGLLAMLRPVYEENLKSLERDFEQARFAGLEIAGLPDLLLEARRRVADRVPIGSAELIEKARAALSESRAFLEHAERVLKRARDAYGEAELLRAATSAQQSRLSTLEKAFEQRQYGRVLEGAGSFEQELRRASRQQVARTIAGVQGLLSQVRKEGASPASAEKLLTEARAALDQGQTVRALQIAGRSEAEVERIGLQVRVARGAFELLKGRLATAHSEGIRAARSEELAEIARQRMESGEAPKVLESVLEAIELLDRSRELHKKAETTLEAADRQIAEAAEAGVDRTDAQTAIEEARRLASTGDYDASIHRALEAAELAQGSIERSFAGSVAEIRRMIDAMGIAGLDGTAAVSEKLDHAEKRYRAKSWEAARVALQEARTEAAAPLEKVVKGRAAALSRLRQQAGLPRSGSPDWETKVTEARERHDFRTLLGLFDEAERETADAAKKQLEEKLAVLKGDLWVGERLGIDTTPAMSRYSAARSALDKGDADAARSNMEEGGALLGGLLRERVATVLPEVEADLKFSREGLRVSVGNLSDRLAEVPKKIAGEEPVAAGRLLLEIGEELETLKALHHELRNLHYLIEAAIYRAGARRIDVGDARRLLDESMKAVSEDYPAAIEKGREALRHLEGVLNSSAPATEFWPFRKPAKSGETPPQ